MASWRAARLRSSPIRQRFALELLSEVFELLRAYAFVVRELISRAAGACLKSSAAAAQADRRAVFERFADAGHGLPDAPVNESLGHQAPKGCDRAWKRSCSSWVPGPLNRYRVCCIPPVLIDL